MKWVHQSSLLGMRENDTINEKEEIMGEVSVSIGGMSCQHCVMRVKKAIDALKGVKSSQVDIGVARVAYDDGETSPEEIEGAVKKAGYTVQR